MSTKLNISMDQGAEYLDYYSVTSASSANLVTYTGACQIRKQYNSTEAIDIDVILTANGVMQLYMSKEETALVEAGRYVYDVEITDQNGNRTRILEGIMTVTPNVTR